MVDDLGATLDALCSKTNGASQRDTLCRAQAAKPSPAKRHTDIEIPSATELAEVIDDERNTTIPVDEGVTSGFTLRNVVNFDYGQLLGLKSGGLGYGLPAAVGVAIAEEERNGETRNVTCYIGDGSYQYYPQALYTAGRYLQDALSVVVVDNSGYRILRESDVLEDRAPTTNQPLSFQPPVHFGKNAESYGVKATRYHPDDSLHETIRTTIEADEVELLTVPTRTG